MRKIVAALTAILVLVGLTGCTKQISADDVEQTIATELQKALGQKPESVKCEDDLKAEVGAEVKCTATISGMEQDVKAKVTKVENNTAYYDITPEGEPRPVS